MQIGYINVIWDEPPVDSEPEEDSLASSKFEYIVFDIILLEKATNCRSKPYDPNDDGDDLVTISYNELTRAFAIAYSTCNTYANSRPQDRKAITLRNTLKNAALSEGYNLKKFINLACLDSVEHLHDCLPFAGEAFQSGGILSILAPDPDGSSIHIFRERYSKLLPHVQDMISRIVYRLRIDLWNRPVTGKELDLDTREGIYMYSARYVKAKSRKTPALKELSSLRKDSSEFPAAVMNLFAGLQINDIVNNKTTYGLRGELKLKTAVVNESHAQSISNSMMALYQTLVPGRKCLEARSRLVQRLQAMLDMAFPFDNLCIQEFGSCASGLGSETSDADLCITTTTFQRSKKYNNMRELAKLLRRSGMISVQPIVGARVPIVKFIDPSTRINCDLNTNHSLGIYNSELIRGYTLIDDRVRPLLYNIKALVKKHGINDSSQSWLSSYAYVMMAIGFLQAQDPPVLPSLQNQPEEYMTKLFVTEECDSRGPRTFDCTFDRNFSDHRNFGAANKKSVGQLLIEFFEYYTRYFNYQTMEVNVRVGGVRLRDGMDAQGKSRGRRAIQPGKGEKQLIVKDPFIRDRNVSGSCRGRHLERVWMIFEYIYLSLSKGDFRAAFQPLSEYYFQSIEEQQISVLSVYKSQGTVASKTKQEESQPETIVNGNTAISTSKMRRDRRANARRFHTENTTQSFETTSDASSSRGRNPSSAKTSTATMPVLDSTSSLVSTSKSSSSSSRTRKVDSTKQKKQLESAYPVLEKTRKIILASKMSNNNTQGSSSSNLRPVLI